MRREHRVRRGSWWSLALAIVGCGGCQSPAAELSGLAQLPPLDYSVLVTGGAFLQPSVGAEPGTFAAIGAPSRAATGVDGDEVEPLRIDDVLDVLRQGAVFRGMAADADLAHRREVLHQLHAKGADPGLLEFLQASRDRGFDLLLVVEQLQDGPIDAHGINGRWPVTLATWLLLGVGAFIPDHTFESGATLRVTVRDLQTGRILFESLTPAGPVDLSLVERSNALGLLLSLVVPPFWVHDDADNVARGMREVTERRLLLSLARELKSEPTRQRLRERAAAALVMLGPRRLSIEAMESVTAVRLRPASGELDDASERAFERTLLETMRRDAGKFVYEAELPAALGGGDVQVLVATITGAVSSATLAVAAQQ